MNSMKPPRMQVLITADQPLTVASATKTCHD